MELVLRDVDAARLWKDAMARIAEVRVEMAVDDRQGWSFDSADRPRDDDERRRAPKITAMKDRV